jgi:hypothetical protein
MFVVCQVFWVLTVFQPPYSSLYLDSYAAYLQVTLEKKTVSTAPLQLHSLPQLTWTRSDEKQIPPPNLDLAGLHEVQNEQCFNIKVFLH